MHLLVPIFSFLAFQDLAILADFDHLEGERRREIEFGDLVFKKEFYSSSVCIMENGEEVRLKKFARSWLEVTETGDDATENREIINLTISEIKCTDPEERKQRLNPKKLLKSDKTASEDTKNDVLADEPHSEKVKDASNISAHSSAIVTKKAHSSTAAARNINRNRLMVAFVMLVAFW